jgi:CheY-like chemotaxis protein
MNSKLKTPILYIEDNSGDFELLKIFLEETGLKCELYQSDSLFEGLALLENTHVDLVLLDLNLSDSSGYKTISTFLEKAPNVPLVILTGINNEIIGNQAVRAGAQDFLVKGQFDGKALGKVIRYAIQRSAQQQKLENAARELELNKRRSIEALEMAHFGYWEMDLVTNEMKWSDEVYRILGRKPGTLPPSLMNFLEFVYHEDMAKVEDFFHEAVNNGTLQSLEHRLLIEGSSIKHVMLHGKIQADTYLGKVLLLGGIQDITERKLSEQLLLERKLSSKTAKIQEEALSEISFQIRTPLSSIVNLLFLLEKSNPGSHQAGYIEDMKSSVDDLSKAVGNLLNFAVMFSDELILNEEEFVLKDLVQGSINVLKLKSDAAKVSVELKIEDSTPERIVSDPKKLMQILYNLIDNAIKNSVAGQKILVHVSASDKVSSTMNLLITIKDTGAGMSKRQLREVQNLDTISSSLSNSEKPPKQQMGIAIVNKLMATLEGKCNIESKEGVGTTISLIIPVKAVRSSRFKEGDRPDTPMSILLVEDHFLNQIATKKVLTSWSEFVEVDIAENGQIALNKMETKHYDIVLMDIQMPVMNGIECTMQIRSKSQIPIIALTANASKQEHDRCLEIGMNDYLSKPFKPVELYSKIIKIFSFVMN